MTNVDLCVNSFLPYHDNQLRLPIILEYNNKFEANFIYNPYCVNITTLLSII